MEPISLILAALAAGAVAAAKDTAGTAVKDAYSGKHLSEIQTKLCLAWFIACDTVPNTTAHRYKLVRYTYFSSLLTFASCLLPKTHNFCTSAD